MRTDQHMGLNQKASLMVAGIKKLLWTDAVQRFFPDGRVEHHLLPFWGSNVSKKPSGEHYTGMFDDAYDLYQYTFEDGTVYKEYVQEAPWSSGPMFFLALKDSEGNPVLLSLWTDEEIQKA